MSDVTLDDILAAIRATTATIVSTSEACRRLNVGPNHLADLVAAGLIKRVPHMRGKGGGHCYHVAEITRCGEELMNASRPHTATRTPPLPPTGGSGVK